MINLQRMTAPVLLALDLVVVFLVFNVIAYFRGVLDPANLLFTALLVPATLVVIALHLVDGYQSRTDMLSVDYASQHAIALVGAMLVMLLITFAFVTGGYELHSSRIVIAVSFVAITPLTLGYRRAIYLRSVSSREARSLVFLGDRPSCESFQAECQRLGTAQSLIFCVGMADSLPPFATARLGEIRLFHEVVDEVGRGELPVEAIVLRESARELPPEISRQLVRLYFSGVPTYTLELFHQVYWQKIPIYRINQTWLFQEGFRIAREPVFERIKRMSDLLLCSIGLLLSSPILALSAVAIWLEDRGPVFFSQTRIGKNHVPFRLLKLRTMRTDAESGSLYTQPGDTRITRVGRFLRATRLDEFPQMWNVIVGHMSLIGPRAEWDRLVENYEQEISCYHFRHLVKPGITGWAQVNYPYGANIEDTVRKLEYDLYYIRHFSFSLDATIVLKTIHLVLFGRGR